MRRTIAAAASAAALLSACPGSAALAATPPASPRLFIAVDGVALSQFPSRSRLSADVEIGVTQSGAKAAWAARSDASWLTVTPSGHTGKALQLQADPAGLKVDTLYVATVTVRTKANSPFQDKETIRVSFWNGSVDPGVVSVSQNAVSLTSNPVEPWVYVADGGSSVAVYNVYSGALVKTFPKVAPSVGKMVTSSDGLHLFAVDATNYRVVEVDAGNGKLVRRIQLQGPLASDFSFAYARPGGAETLFAAGQPAMDVTTGQAVSATLSGPNGGWYDPFITATADGSRLGVLERSLDPGSLYSYTVAADDSGQLAITLAQSNGFIEGENCQDMAMSPDGTRLYPACGWPYEFDVYDWSTLAQVQTLAAVPYPDNATFDSAGDFVGGVNGLYQDFDVFVYNFKGYLKGEVASTAQSQNDGQGNDLLVASGDSTRVISATAAVYNSQQTLIFRSLP